MFGVTEINTILPWIAILIMFCGCIGLCFKLVGALEKVADTSSKVLAMLPGMSVSLAPVTKVTPSSPALPVPQVPQPPAKPVVIQAEPPIVTGPPPWFLWAQHEIGFHEQPGNTGIQKYIDLAHCGAEGEPWCAIFANAALEACGISGTRSPSSQSFRTHPDFIKLDNPARGAVVVFWRGSGPNSGIGHVGFYDGEDATHIRTLGGNENDQVLDEDFPKSSKTFGLVGYWWPKSVPLPNTGTVVSQKVSPPSKVVVMTPAPTNQTNIVATMFDDSGNTAYRSHDSTKPAVALPFRFSDPRPMVKVTNKSNGKSTVCSIGDVGPWNLNDPYWTTGQRPQSETGFDLGQTTGGKPRKTNKAGIDLNPIAAETILIDGKGLVDWEFLQSPAAETPKVS